MFRWFLRKCCDARQLAALRRLDAGRRLRLARRQELQLYDDLLGDGPAGPMSYRLLVPMAAAFHRDVIPIRRERLLARRELCNALALCREVGLGRWQIRLALR